MRKSKQKLLAGILCMAITIASIVSAAGITASASELKQQESDADILGGG